MLRLLDDNLPVRDINLWNKLRSMTPENKKYKRLVALFLFGLVLLNYPILSLLNIDIMIFGLPLLYVYIFCIWGLLIFLSALVTNRSKEHTENSEKSGN